MADTHPTQHVTRWHPYVEWSIEVSTGNGNPFDVDATSIFTHEQTGTTHTTGMFHENGTWSFRFTSVLEGSWTFRTFSDVPQLHGHTGQVDVTPNPDPAAHGFMKGMGSKWGWQGTETAFTPQYVMGKVHTAYYDGDGIDEGQIDRDIEEFVDGHGFTGFNIPCDGRWFDGENPDPRAYRVLETIISRVHARGGACHLWMWGSGSRGEDGTGPVAMAGGPMSEIDRRNLRYLAARLGPLPGWSIGYGFDCENGWAPVKELEAWKDFLKSEFGWDHFVGARVGYDEKGLFGIKPHPGRPPKDFGNRSPLCDDYTFWLGGDYLGYTSYRPLYPRYVQAIEHHGDRPSFEEDRFRLRDLDQWTYKDYSEDLTRRGLWHSVLAGGVANIWGNLLPTDDHKGSRPYAIKDQIKTYSHFFENRFLVEMMTEFIGPELRLSTEAHEHAIVYREDTDQVRIDLSRSPRPLPAIAVDTLQPYKEIEIGMLEAGPNTWEAPHRSDWAIAVGSY